MSKKKSAMQKGYRKQVKAKPFLTKKDIITLIAIVAVVILAILLFNLLYDDGLMGAKQVQPNDLVAYGSTNVRDRYKKLAEIGEKDGFTRTSSATETMPVGAFEFTPDSEMGNLDSFSVSGSFVPASTLTDTFVSYANGSGIEIMEPVEITINGHDAYIFAYESEYYSTANDPDAVEGETVDSASMPDNTFEQYLSAYISADDTHTIALHAKLVGEDSSFYLPHEEVEDYLLQFADVINMDFDVKK